MPIEFKTEEERNPTTVVLGRVPKNRNIEPKIVEDNLTQNIFAEGEEEKLAIQFIEENDLYTKFMLWCGIQDQLKNIKSSLESPNS
jgi:hypothetical protein